MQSNWDMALQLSDLIKYVHMALYSHRLLLS